MLDRDNTNSHATDNELKIVLVKPGATDFDDQGRIIGSLDVPLSDLGIEQAQNAAKELENVDMTAVFSGPCLSAQQTAVEITAKTRVRPRVEPLLKNIDMGLWQGRQFAELQTNQPRFVKQWRENPEQICPPQGETLMDVRPRVDALLKRITRKHRSGTVVIVVADPIASVIASRIDMLESGVSHAAQDKPNPADTHLSSSSKTEFGCLRTFQLSSGFAI